MELALGIFCPGVDYLKVFGISIASSKRSSISISVGESVSLPALASHSGGRVGQVLLSVIPIIANVSRQLGIKNPLANTILGDLLGGVNRQCLHTT